MPQTGATRYQKFLKSEKNKTKLKAKKDLPKGTNVTKTNFKVKKIVLKEQLKKHSDTEILSTRKLNINELLSRLNHFNTKSKLDALQELKDLIGVHPQLLQQNLGLIINIVTPLMLNIEKTVRRDTLQVLNTVLTNLSIEKIDPFYDVMSTYLRSAMTDIDNRIQEDSLLFLDILLLNAAYKVVKDFHKILPNFLDMISKLRVDSKPGRTLTVNLGSKMTSVKWRVKVLHRLQDYLMKFVQYENIDEQEQLAGKIKVFDTSKFNHYPLFNTNYISVCSLSCLSSKQLQEINPVDEVAKFMEYMNTLMPLLFETWVEVCPATSGGKNIETVITEDAALLLKYILEIILLLWNILKYLNKKNPNSNVLKMFSQKYRQQYIQHFVKIFPFVTNIRTKLKNENTPFENVITDPKLVTENLKICHLFILMNPNLNVKTNNKEIVTVLAYLERIFIQNTQEHIHDVVMNILDTIFSKEINSWTRTMSVMDALFKKIISTYFNNSLTDSLKQKIFKLLCRIGLNKNLEHFQQIDAFEMWLKYLPDILLGESLDKQTIEIIHRFAVCNNDTFNTIIKPKLLKIIDNFPNIKIVDATNESYSYYKLFGLLNWIKVWDRESLNLLEQQIHNSAYKSDYGKFIFDTLRLRTGGIL